VSGLVLTGTGVYWQLDSADESGSIVSLASEHRTDPGGVYDRPIGTLPSPDPTPALVAAPPPDQSPFRDASYRLVIDRIGVNAPVFTYGLDAEQIPEVPLNGSDVAWYDFSSAPGTGSNAVFAGHVTWGGPAVFYKLDDVQVGDNIILRSDDGTELTYAVSDTLLVDPKDSASLSVMSPTDDDVITLITCGGSFYYTGDPVFNGDYTHRRIVRALFAGQNQPPAAGG
jgi:LPXTG-site transpeptidase (sortase) family protein